MFCLCLSVLTVISALIDECHTTPGRCSFSCHGPAARIWKASIFQHGQGVVKGIKGRHKGAAGSYVGLALVHVLREIKSARTLLAAQAPFGSRVR